MLPVRRRSYADDFELNLTTNTLARFVQLSATNEPPHDADLSVIRPIVDKTSTRLASLDAEILRFKIRLRELEEEHAILSRYNAQGTSIISSSRRIPSEILAEIFSWTSSPHYVLGTENCPWVLTHVCSRWRAIALALPALWSLVVLDFSISAHYPLEMLRIQLERARSPKIHFIGTQAGDSSVQIALFEFLAKQSARWEELNIRMTSHLIPYVRALQCNLTALRRAWVTWDTPESQPQEFDAVEFFRMAISLVDLGVFSKHHFLPTRLPMVHHLTRYDFDATWNAHSELLKSLPNLQEACMRCCFDDDED